MKHNIIIAATVQSYCSIAVDAETEQEAERLVQESIDKEGFESPFYQNAVVVGRVVENLRIV
jgi:hypothetical protein